ncbi:Hypothetical protein KVN_LOCUS441 [uncultured virus]|nr:Hypothetical protein KVN_LOCUS441 [uncultured virus]
MYINKIDELIDRILDDFYNKIIINNKEIDNILNETNFVKYQLEINRILSDYTKTINPQQIFDIIQNQSNVNIILEIIKRYLGYYIFLFLWIFYNGKKETYINNIIEFTKNQPGFNFKIENFFNSENNSNIIKFSNLIENIYVLLQESSGKITQLSKKPEFRETIAFLNNLGQEFINQKFRSENLAGSEKDQAHNIIKTIILTELYFNIDKKEVYLILEAAEKEQGIYTFIDIVIPRTEFIDFNTIERSLSKRDSDKGLAYEIYNLIIKYEDLERTKELTPDEKILKLINNNLLVPICDDFLLYHKDNEKYEKQTIGKKKKEETKIRYIVTKIDNVGEYYSEEIKKNMEAKKNIERHFYLPLSERKAIIVNHLEDVKIINKLMNQGRRTIENNEYYNDLVTYKQYPYINFKNFKEYGFNLILNNTIDVIRYSSIERQLNESLGLDKYLQLRIGSKGQNLNIIGFMVPTTQNNLQCVKARELINIIDIGYKKNDKTNEKFKNGYIGIIKFLKHILFKKKKNKSSIYWIIDIKNDLTKLENYEQTGRLNDQDNTKLIASNIYDDLLSMMYEKILNTLNKKDKTSLYEFDKIVNNLEKKVFDFNRESQLFNRLEHIFYTDKYIVTEAVYDRDEDKFPGLYGDIIKLPEYSISKKTKMPTIVFSLEKNIEQKIEDELGAESYGAICQHIITWENISAIRKKNPNEFTKLLFEFILQYVIENYQDNFICKSCSTQINIKNYVLDGSYDDEGRFITFSTPMDVPLEDVPEYEKYKMTIRNLDKIVERIATISNIRFLLEKTSRQKNPIKIRIIKNSLDMLLIHNDNMKEIYRERSEKIFSKYGITKELSNFFVFELDNNIFVYSSKDKDHYKPIKRNNILVYLILMILLEFNDSQIIYLIGDKTCNYYLFSKFGYQLFNNLKIIKNNKGLSTPIQNYKVLCYLIFYISCLITKYNMWQYEEADKNKIKKFNPLVQKIIIQTLVDLINSILEIYAQPKEKNYVYEIVSVKFFQKLNSTFQNNEILKKIKDIEEMRVSNDGDKRRVKIVKIKPMILPTIYEIIDYQGINIWDKCKIAKYFINILGTIYQKHYNITNVTNCPQGTFHSWENKGKTLECAICKLLIDKISLKEDQTSSIIENYRYINLKKLAEKYCSDRSFHNFIYDNKLKCDVCTKCKYSEVNELSKIDLDELEKNVGELNLVKDDDHIKYIEKKEIIEEKKIKKINLVIKEIKNEYAKTKTHKEDYFNHIDILINNIDSIIGKNVNINNENLYSKWDVYIIDHDHNGYLLPNPIILSEQDGKIQFKKNHPFFNKDVLFYTNNKLQIDVFYDAITLLLLGFKERNKDFEVSKRNNIYLKINYSIFNKLKFFGYSTRFMDTKKLIDEITLTYNLTEPQDIIHEIVSNVSRNRIQNLKKIITYIQRYLYRIKYNYEQPERIIIDEDEVENPDKFLDKYKGKLKNLTVRKDKEKVFKNWKIVNHNIFFQNLEDKVINLDIESNYIFATDIGLYDYHGNIILFYIVNELNKLLEFNTEKYLKINLTYLIIDIINKIHDLFNQEKEYTNYEIKRFNYILNSQQYIYDFEEAGHGVSGEVENFYQEAKDTDEPVDEAAQAQREEDLEERDALDTEIPLGNDDYETDYMDRINFN